MVTLNGTVAVDGVPTMGLRKWFGRGGEEGETFEDYTLSAMKSGYMVDYDLRTWQVTAYQTYDYDGFVTTEWELVQGKEIRFLERSEDDGRIEWTFTQRIEINQIEEPVIDHIVTHEDPPETITYQGRSYHAVESSAGLMREQGEGEGVEFVSWSYEGEDDRLLFITQWGERDFKAYEGIYAEEYQFSDILPGPAE